MEVDLVARRIFKEQIQKELLEEISGYMVGWVHNGEMIATKKSDNWSGYIFVIPDEKYKELFK